MCCGEPNTTCVGSSLPTFLLSPEQVFFPQSGHSDTELWEGPVAERCCLYEASSTVATVFFFFFFPVYLFVFSNPLKIKCLFLQGEGKNMT